MADSIRVRLNGRRVTIRPGETIYGVLNLDRGVRLFSCQIEAVRRERYGAEVQIDPIHGGWEQLTSGMHFLDEREALRQYHRLLMLRIVALDSEHENVTMARLWAEKRLGDLGD